MRDPAAGRISLAEFICLLFLFLVLTACRFVSSVPSPDAKEVISTSTVGDSLSHPTFPATVIQSTEAVDTPRPTFQEDKVRIPILPSSAEGLIIYDGGDLPTNTDFYAIYPDGSNQTCLTCGLDHLRPWGVTAVSPDGTLIAYKAVSYPLTLSGLAVMNLKLGEIQIYPLPLEAYHPHRHTRIIWSPDSSRIALITDHDLDLMDLSSRQLNRVIEDVRGQAIWLDNERIAFVDTRSLIAVSLDGTLETMIDPIRLGNWFSWSPDRRHIVYEFGSGLSVINIIDESRYLLVSENAFSPHWSSDGEKIIFSRGLGGGLQDLFLVNIDGSELVRITDGSGVNFFKAWSPDSTKVLFSKQAFDGKLPTFYTADINGTKINQVGIFYAQDIFWVP